MKENELKNSKSETPDESMGKAVGKAAVKAISMVIIITLAGKFLGLWRDRLLAVNYGTGMYANAFLTASRLPRVFFDMLFASAISSSFIPVFNEVYKKRSRDHAIRFAGNFITIIGAATLILTAVGMIFSGPLVNLIADGYDSETMALCVRLTRMLFPTIFFTGVAYAFVGILQSFDEFNIPAAISVLSNVVIICYYYFLNGRFGIYGLAVAFLAGWAMQAIVQIPSLRKKGFYFKPSFDLKNENIRKVFTLMIPVMISTWVQPISLLINTRFASHMYGGSGVSSVEYSMNLYLTIIGVLILSVTNVIFPRLSRLGVSEENDKFNSTIRATMHASMFIVIPLMFGVMALSTELIDLIYGGGQFVGRDIDITGKAMFYTSLGMIGYAGQNILNKAYFAKMDGKTPFIAGVVSIAANVVLCMLFADKFQVSGLALISAVVSTINALVLWLVLEKRGEGFMSWKFLFDVLKMTAAALVMAVAVRGSAKLISLYWSAPAEKLAVLIIPTIIGLLVYFVLALLFRFDEMKLLGRGGKNKEEAK